MKIMLDCSPAKIAAYSKRYDYEFWQLRTPLTRYQYAGVPYGLDNGCFKSFDEQSWNTLIREAEENHPLFITAPDLVGSAQRTIELFHVFKRKLHGLPIALVLQDGIESVTIPWDEISGGVFVGGTDAFKTSRECLNTLKTAGMLKKYIHIGRVNSARRIQDFVQAEKDYGFKVDSIDGSGMSRFDERLEVVLSAIRNEDPQMEIDA